jgi:Ca-activated chloride channel family protein
MPAYDDAGVDWKGMTVEQAPGRVPPVFAGDVLTVFARIESGSASAVELVVGGERFAVPLDLERAEPGGPIPTLWAREAILELDDTTLRSGSNQSRPGSEDRRHARLVELGKRYGLMNSATSFVAVEERPASEQVNARAELRKIPVALTSGWGLGRDVTRRMVGGAMPAMAVLSSPAPMAPMRFAAAPPPAPSAVPAGGIWAMAKRAVLGEGSAKGGAEPRVGHAEAARGASTYAVDPLYDVLMTQSAGGGFKLSPVLANWLGAERMERLAPHLKAQDEAVVVTSVVIAILERDHADREPEWRPAVAKAKGWLAKQSSSFDASRFQ